MATVTSEPTDERLSATAFMSSMFSGTSAGLIAVGLLTVGHLPLLVTYFRRLLLFDHYQFVPLVLIGVPVMLVARGRSIPRSAWRGGFPGRALAVSCGTLAVASLFCSPWAAMVSFVLSSGMFLRHYSGAHWRKLMPVWMLLLLIIRPPLHLDMSLITKLQIETSKVSSIVLENLGVKHLMDGNVLVIPQRRFLIEEACSGINSVFALLTAAAFYAVCVHATMLRAVLLIGSAIFWACFMNLVRIAATIFVFEQFQIDIGEGLAHTIAGLVTFSLAVLFVAFTDQMVRFFLDPIDPRAVEFWKQQRNPIVKLWNRQRPAIQAETLDVALPQPMAAVKNRTITVAIGVFSVLAAGWQLKVLKAETQSQQAPAVIQALAPDSLPSQIGNWSQAGFEIEHRKKNSILGDVSKIWKFQTPAHGTILSIDYPFRGWHSLSICYRGQGWEIDKYRSIPLPVWEDGRSIHMSEVMMHRPTGEKAMLLFVLMDIRGRPIRDPTIGSFWIQTARRSLERLQRPFALSIPVLAPNSGVNTQVQMLIVSDGDPISSETQDEARENFASLHSHLVGLIRSEAASASAEDTK